MLGPIAGRLLASGAGRQTIARAATGIALVALALLFSIAAFALMLGAAYLALASELAPWAAALATGGIALAGALGCLLLARRSAPRPRDPAEMAAGMIERHPLGSVAVALAAGVMVGKDQHSVDRVVKLMLGR